MSFIILNIQFIYNIKHSIHLQYYHLIIDKRNKKKTLNWMITRELN